MHAQGAARVPHPMNGQKNTGSSHGIKNNSEYSPSFSISSSWLPCCIILPLSRTKILSQNLQLDNLCEI